jgi:hypothetical protein
MEKIDLFSIILVSLLLILALILRYQPKEGIIGPGVGSILSNKPFITLARLQTCLLTLTVALGVNLEEILLSLDIHNKSKDLLFISFATGGLISSIAYSL